MLLTRLQEYLHSSKELQFRPMHNAALLALLTLTLGSMFNMTSARCPPQCRCEGKTSDCSHFDLKSVPILLDPRSHVLRLRGSNINTIENSLGFYPRLRELDLYNNSLTTLLEGQFIISNELKQLKLQKNRIDRLTRATFEGLSMLSDLDLSDNHLTVLESGVFRWTEKLRRLNLANNRIRSIARDAFENLGQLRILNLSSNDVNHVPADSFRHLVSLRSLSLSSNSLKEVPFHAFFMLQSLRNLSLANNQIYRIHPEAFTGLFDLNRLDISGNLLDKFPATSLALPGLETLNAGNNSFSSLQVHHMHGLRRLRVLRLCGSTKLRHVADDAFSDNLILEELHVCDNSQLRYLSRGVFNSLPNVKVLNLGGNGLVGLDNLTDILRRINLFNASDNPLVCNCSVKWLWDVQQSQTNTSLVIPPVRCVDTGRLLSATSLSQLGCNQWLTPLIAVVVSFVVIFCAAFVIWLVLRRKRERDKQLACVTEGCVRSYSNQWEDAMSDTDDVRDDDVKACQLLTQIDQPPYGSLQRYEHFTFRSPDYQKKIPVTVV